ncbi:Crp/Fnr family transcriptional regulator [Virgibacillus dokdonensis]|uniref:Crp/Fnr family transcriptional regulator n=1 Tax=Virgibacillus dokdonensis TaxID=302167 RepID=A0A3E0WPI7_9BACI|nr:Crp/Fnr family transcriptional regulator [Virgibacillus dokdonensis]RFA33947.1 Crp/Fnr family transcriptional regulator [Virgibacillus dokdonensis]
MGSKGKACKVDTCKKHPANCVTMVPIFNHLDRQQMEDVMHHVHAVTFNQGDTIYRAGDQATSLYITHTGKIKIYRLSDEGKEQIVRILLPGDFTGELAVFKDSVHEAYAEAMVQTKVCMISRTTMQKLIMNYPSVSLKILEEFANRLEQSETQTTRFATEPVDSRLILFLVENMDVHNQRVELPMSYKDLASYLGTTPETVSRVLKELQVKGYIRKESHQRIDLLNVDALLML